MCIMIILLTILHLAHLAAIFVRFDGNPPCIISTPAIHWPTGKTDMALRALPVQGCFVFRHRATLHDVVCGLDTKTLTT